MKKPDRKDGLVQLGVIGAAQGLRGAVRVKTFTGDPLALGDYGPLVTDAGRRLTMLEVRPAGTVVVARFAEIGDRGAAEALKGTGLYVPRAALPADLGADEYYHADLVGLAVLDETGARRGAVVALHDFGAGDILEIRLDGGDVAMVPFSRAAVPVVDPGAGLLRIDALAAGLAGDDSEGGGA